MIKLQNSDKIVSIYCATEKPSNPEALPVLHISLADGLNHNERHDYLNKLLISDSEWYLSYGPDALLWSQSAESLMLSYISSDPLMHYNFQTLHYEEDTPLSKVWYNFLSLGSSKNDNQAYKSFIVICDSPDETATSLRKLDFTEVN